MINQHFEDLVKCYPQLSVCEKDFKDAYEILVDCYKGKKKLLVCGNGGSAADAEHIVGELMKSFVKKRPLTDDHFKKVSSLGESLAIKFQNSLEEGLPAIALTSHVALSTAFANDVAPQMVFAQQAFVLGVEGDVLMGISTSGNSENVLLALEIARANGLKTIGMTGKSGGKMESVCDICLKMPETETYKIQELHLPVYHKLCIALEDQFF